MDKETAIKKGAKVLWQCSFLVANPGFSNYCNNKDHYGLYAIFPNGTYSEIKEASQCVRTVSQTKQ